MFLVCEPRCEGYEHVEFNAALLAALRAAGAGPILFLAEPGHLGLVAERAAAAGVDRVAWRPLTIPRRGGARGALAETRLHRDVLRLARDRRAEQVVFTSTSSAGLFALKLLAAASPAPITVVPHGELEPLADPGRAAPYAQVLRMPNPSRLRYLFLSPEIERAALIAAPRLAGCTASIEHPYLFAPPAEHVPSAPPVRFGTVGLASRGRGLGELVLLARDLAAARPGRASFTHVGPIAPEDAQLAEGARDVIAFPAVRGYLDRRTYDREIASLDYVLFLGAPGRGRLSACGAAFDALSLARPIIALRGPYLEHLFEQVGDVGYLCDSMAQLRTLARSLCSRFPRSHYAAQRQQALQGRGAFAPEAVARQLEAAWEAWDGRAGRRASA